jgi:Zn-dependent protease with chaperone function
VIALFIVPLLVPFAASLLAPRVVDRFEPAAALWALTVTTIVLATSSLAALGALLLPGVLRLSLFARLGELIHPLDVGPALFLYPATVLSVGALTVCAWTVSRSAARQWQHLRIAHAQAETRQAAGDLSIVNDDCPDAYALPGKPGRIVVTSGMLRALNPSEREALFAHERAHLTGRHHWFLAAAELSAHCHPALRTVCTAIVLAAERTADEAAASATGDRRMTARAIARAALASSDTFRTRPSFTPSAASGPVPRRVAALLHRPIRRSRLAPAVALLLLLCATASAATALTGAVSLHSSVESAQGENRGG